MDNSINKMPWSNMILDVLIRPILSQVIFLINSVQDQLTIFFRI